MVASSGFSAANLTQKKNKTLFGQTKIKPSHTMMGDQRLPCHIVDAKIWDFYKDSFVAYCPDYFVSTGFQRYHKVARTLMAYELDNLKVNKPLFSFHFPSLSLSIPKLPYQKSSVSFLFNSFPPLKPYETIIFPTKTSNFAIFPGRTAPPQAAQRGPRPAKRPPKRARSSATETNSNEPTWKERPLTCRQRSRHSRTGVPLQGGAPPVMGYNPINYRYITYKP